VPQTSAQTEKFTKEDSKKQKIYVGEDVGKQEKPAVEEKHCR